LPGWVLYEKRDENLSSLGSSRLGGRVCGTVEWWAGTPPGNEQIKQPTTKMSRLKTPNQIFFGINPKVALGT